MNSNYQNGILKFSTLFPEVTIKQIEYVQGAEHYVLAINDTFICKFPKNPDSLLLEKEAAILMLLEGKITTKIPTLLYCDPQFLVYDKIPGKELTVQEYQAFSTEEREMLSRDVAFFLSELHAAFTKEDVARLNLTQTNWPWSAERLQEKVSFIDDHELVSIFSTFIDEYRALTNEKMLVVVHNDLIMRNIIIDPVNHRLNGIIDFTDVAFDSFLLDLRCNYETIQIPEFVTRAVEYYKDFTSRISEPSASFIYFLAVEFSRYIQLREEQKSDELPKIKQRIFDGNSYLQGLNKV